MDVTTTSFTPTQMILAWTLLVLLLSWFILFAVLALHNVFMKKDAWEEVSTPSRPVPIVGIQSEEEHQSFVEMTGNTIHHEHPNAERFRDSDTSLIT